jgi:hypothetical protein
MYEYLSIANPMTIELNLVKYEGKSVDPPNKLTLKGVRTISINNLRNDILT